MTLALLILISPFALAGLMAVLFLARLGRNLAGVR